MCVADCDGSYNLSRNNFVADSVLHAAMNLAICLVARQLVARTIASCNRGLTKIFITIDAIFYRILTTGLFITATHVTSG